MNENKDWNYYTTFQVEHPEYGLYKRQLKINDAASWTDHLREYVDFLGTVYGYSIRDKVAVGGMVFGDWVTHGHPTFEDIIEEANSVKETREEGLHTLDPFAEESDGFDVYAAVNRFKKLIDAEPLNAGYHVRCFLDAVDKRDTAYYEGW
jgi:hypothetical protein